MQDRSKSRRRSTLYCLGRAVAATGKVWCPDGAVAALRWPHAWVACPVGRGRGAGRRVPAGARARVGRLPWSDRGPGHPGRRLADRPGGDHAGTGARPHDRTVAGGRDRPSDPAARCRPRRTPRPPGPFPWSAAGSPPRSGCTRALRWSSCRSSGWWPEAGRLGARRAGGVRESCHGGAHLAGLFVRLPWSRPLSDERRRAVSALLVTGARAPRPPWPLRPDPATASCRRGGRGCSGGRHGPGHPDGQPRRADPGFRIGPARGAGVGRVGRDASGPGDLGRPRGPGGCVGRARASARAGPVAGARPWCWVRPLPCSPRWGWPRAHGPCRPRGARCRRGAGAGRVPARCATAGSPLGPGRRPH